MTFLLAFLLCITLVALALLGFHTVQLHIKLAQACAVSSAERSRLERECQQSKEQVSAVQNQYQALIAKYNEETKRWKMHINAMNNEISRLSKWKGVADAEVRAEEMVRSAQKTLEAARGEAKRIITEAEEQARKTLSEATAAAETEVTTLKEQAKSIAAEAQKKAQTLTSQAQGILDSATSQAARIVEAARNNAQAIAADAYEAKRNVSQYEEAIRALKNLLSGYGDEYLVPPQSVLDDLAESYSHTDAGIQLKRARETTRIMVRNGTAATCDYVEANRRDTAIRFVVDAFNGKVDSILSRVKSDNVGKLEQEIRDAFALVNINGKAFRDARITEEYLNARLDELRWASVNHQLALREREEQRRAKEIAKEEAKAARERERAIRDAAREEETLRRAIAHAQAEFEAATEAQKAKYEERLKEMEERLREAEERKQRAVSMAQLTTKGYVYIISNVGSFGEDVYKIGLTRRWDPYDRVRELGDASVPFEFDVHAMILHDNAPELERALHNHFLLRQVNKVNYRKEFFRVSLREIREEIERLGITTGIHWTMTAQAREYRETLAIEKAIQEDPNMREAWMKRQLSLESVEVGVGHADTDDDFE